MTDYALRLIEPVGDAPVPTEAGWVRRYDPATGALETVPDSRKAMRFATALQAVEFAETGSLRRTWRLAVAMLSE